MQRVEISTTAAGAPSLPMSGVWPTIRSYIFWQHERGTLHYDIMVTLILLFIFSSPYWINFNDKPVPAQSASDGCGCDARCSRGLVYEISGAAISAGDGGSVRDQLLKIIEPISGAVSIVKIDVVSDRKGKVQSYRVLVKRE